MSKFLSVEEFADWAAKHSPAEVAEKTVELQNQLAPQAFRDGSAVGPFFEDASFLWRGKYSSIY